jgi:hypothetical protein
MQVDIGQEWANNPSLGRAFCCGFEEFSVHHPGLKKFLDEVEDFLVFDAMCDKFKESLMANRIEVGGNVPFDHPEVFLAFRGTPAEIAESIHGAAVWAEAKGILTKIRFVDGLQNHAERFLYNPVSYGRDAQGAYPAVGFRNVYPPYRIRFEDARPEICGKLLEITLHSLIEGLHVYAVTSRRFTAGVLGDIIMSQSEPILIIEQMVEGIESMPFILFCPKAKFSL